MHGQGMMEQNYKGVRSYEPIPEAKAKKMISNVMNQLNGFGVQHIACPKIKKIDQQLSRLFNDVPPYYSSDTEIGTWDGDDGVWKKEHRMMLPSRRGGVGGLLPVPPRKFGAPTKPPFRRRWRASSYS